MQFESKGIPIRERKMVDKNKATFEIKEGASLLGDKEKGIHINLFDEGQPVGGVLIEELNNKELGKQFVQLRFVGVEKKYQGGNAVIMLYEKSIEYAESLNKKLLFDSSLTVGAYKSFKKLEDLGYKVIENPEAKFDGSTYLAPKSWVLRVERKQKDEK